jgi:hypothetical protein
MPFATFDSICSGISALGHLLSRRSARVCVAAAGLVTTLLVGAISAQAAAAYQNPFAGEQPYVGRTDMGVDVCLSPGQPIRAMGKGVVVGIQRDWAAGQPYLWYELTGGPDAGRYVYVAEQINRLARVGQPLQAGDVVARYANKGTCIETGWSEADGETVAQATTGYTEGQVTVAGVSFARFLLTLGVQGQFDLVPARATSAKPSKKRHKKPVPRHRTVVTTADDGRASPATGR